MVFDTFCKTTGQFQFKSLGQAARKLSPVVSLVALLQLSGCASWLSSKDPTPSLANADRTAQLQAMQNFELNAAMGVKAPGESVSGSLQWQQQGPFFKAEMSNLFGLSVFKVHTDPDGATVVVEGQTHHAQNPAVLLDYLSGWSLPIEGMSQWLKGLPSQDADQLQYDSLGRLVGFTLFDSRNQQWHVHYDEFFPTPLALPKKIRLESKESRLKLMIRSWQ